MYTLLKFHLMSAVKNPPESEIVHDSCQVMSQFARSFARPFQGAQASSKPQAASLRVSATPAKFGLQP